MIDSMARGGPLRVNGMSPDGPGLVVSKFATCACYWKMLSFFAELLLGCWSRCPVAAWSEAMFWKSSASLLFPELWDLGQGLKEPPLGRSGITSIFPKRESRFWCWPVRAAKSSSPMTAPKLSSGPSWLPARASGPCSVWNGWMGGGCWLRRAGVISGLTLGGGDVASIQPSLLFKDVGAGPATGWGGPVDSMCSSTTGTEGVWDSPFAAFADS